MKTLRQWHHYLGVLFAPLLIFFAATGSWQLFGLHQNAKDGSYTAPAYLSAPAVIHKNSHLPGTPRTVPTPLRWFSLAAALGMIGTTVLGLVLAFRFTAKTSRVWACLAAGILVPVILLPIYR
jgi:uncharacterized iron-regulated membrane protein